MIVERVYILHVVKKCLMLVSVFPLLHVRMHVFIVQPYEHY